MDILSINAQQKLATMASYIGRNPASWKGWHALRIILSDIDDDVRQDCLLWCKSIIEAYLKGTEGRVYLSENAEIHILCKAVPAAVLEQAGRQICDLVYNENQVSAECTLYALDKDGFAYAQSVLEQSNIFSLPVSPFSMPGLAEMDRQASSHFDDSEVRAQIPHGETKVLLVEDDPVTRWMVRNALKDECSFATASSANRAFLLYSSYQPDIVFLDIDLPDNNGLAVLEWIINNDPGACVVMFSGNDNMDTIANTLRDGASGFVAKPFLKENLLHYINNRM